jgi:integrase/recombinase XerD
MGRLERIASAVAAILAREGVDYQQSKAVFKAARQKAGLGAPPDRRGTIDRLTPATVSTSLIAAKPTAACCRAR